MFDKGELAAILRFGAEDLFKQLERDDDEVKQRDQKLYGEDIDAILARAEVWSCVHPRLLLQWFRRLHFQASSVVLLKFLGSTKSGIVDYR